MGRVGPHHRADVAARQHGPGAAVAEAALEGEERPTHLGIAATTDAPWLTASLRSVPRLRSAAVTAAAAAAALALSVNGLPACSSSEATAR